MEQDVYLWAGFVALILSEAIALMPRLKSNSVLQLVVNIAKRLSRK